MVVLAALCATLMLSACQAQPKEVADISTAVVMNGEEMQGTYTGTMLQDKASGEGAIKLNDNGTEWTFRGTFENGEAKNGTVENLKLSVKLADQEMTGTYEGETISGVPTGTGVFRSDKSETVYEGGFAEAAPAGEGKVTELTLVLPYEEEELEGIYNGATKEGIPGGEGKFAYEKKGDYFEYEGGWENGKMAGKGELESNMYIVHFAEVDRTGTYEGEMLDGVASGEGKFSATSSDDVDYTYEGQWANGLYNGEGHKKYDHEDYSEEWGNFKDGEFTPTFEQYVVSCGTRGKQEYTVSGKSFDFIKQHKEIFENHAIDQTEGLIDEEFDFKAFAKDQSNYGDKLIKVSSAEVVQTRIESGNTFMICQKGDRVYYINFAGEVEGVEGDRVTLYLLPLDYFTYPNVSGTDIWAMACAGVAVEQ